MSDTTFLIWAGSLIFIMLPVFPESLFSFRDPSSCDDDRVRIDIDDESLNQIITLVRRRCLISIFGGLNSSNRRKILMILEVTGEEFNKKYIEERCVRITMGEVRGPLCGQGTEYYLVKYPRSWKIKKRTMRVS